MFQRAQQVLGIGNKQTNYHWKTAERSILVCGDHVRPCEKVAAFDLDGTLIHWKQGQKFSLEPGSWIWYSDNVVPKLKRIHERGHRIVVFTNQAKARRPGSPEAANFMAKMNEILSQVGVPMTVYAATSYDRNRKPGEGMWKYFRRTSNSGAQVDKLMSFYVGDAAGRKYDFSGSDRQFADRIGLPFNTPEEMFGPSSQPNHALAYYLETLAKQLLDSGHPGDTERATAMLQASAEIETHPMRFTSSEDAMCVEAVKDHPGMLHLIDEFCRSY